MTFWWPMWGQRLPKLLKLSKLPNVTFCPKTVKIGAKLKKTKTALSGVSQQSFCQGVCQSVLCVPECFARQSRPVQAQRPCPAFPSLLQLIPARSGPGALPRGPGRVPIIQGASWRSYRGLDSAQGCTQVKSSPCAPPAHRNCAQDGKPCVSGHCKNSKLNILFLLFDI